MAPGDGLIQGLLMIGRIAIGLCRQANTLLQLIEDPGRAEQWDPG